MRFKLLISTSSAVFMGTTMALAWANAPAAPDATVDGREGVRFDVCDASYLWPVPRTEADVLALVSADQSGDRPGSEIWPEQAFNAMLEIATGDAAVITHPRGQEHRIALPAEVRDRKAWKVAAFRIDGGAPGGHSAIVAKFGSSPQLRLVLQPVTVQGGKVKVHDFAVHLVRNFVKDPKKAEAGFLPVAVPDEEKFRSILVDLVALKRKLKDRGVDTQGAPLGVHPGLKSDVTQAEFAQDLAKFLKSHVQEANITAMALMGLPSGKPEPWIFVGARRLPNGTFDAAPVPALGGKPAQMVSFVDGDPAVFPTPMPTNRNPISNFLGTPPLERRGVATAVLFASGLENPDAAAVLGMDASGSPITASDGAPPLRNKDIPDLIANPDLAHFFSTDCISCHSESTRRSEMINRGKLREGDPSPFGYVRPEGVSGIDPDAAAREPWNVRCFGWFPDFFNEGTTRATVTMRTANETADCVEFINRVYFGKE